MKRLYIFKIKGWFWHAFLRLTHPCTPFVDDAGGTGTWAIHGLALGGTVAVYPSNAKPTYALSTQRVATLSCPDIDHVLPLETPKPPPCRVRYATCRARACARLCALYHALTRNVCVSTMVHRTLAIKMAAGTRNDFNWWGQHPGGAGRD